jgi:hypothetical protein
MFESMAMPLQQLITAGIVTINVASKGKLRSSKKLRRSPVQQKTHVRMLLVQYV